MGFLPLWLQYWSQLQLVSSAASFFPLSETDKVDTFSFSKNTVEIAPLDCGTHRYQTATGTGSSIHNTDKTVDIHTNTHIHTFPICLFPALHISIFQLSWASFALCFFSICHPDILSFSGWASILSLSHLLLLESSFWLLHWSLRVKGTNTHIYTHSLTWCLNAHTQSAHTHTRAAGDPEALHSSFGHTNLISWHTELSWCKLVCFLCFSRLYLLWEGFCSLGQQVVNKLGVKGGTSACFPVYQILSFRLYREIEFRFEVTVGCDQDISLWPLSFCHNVLKDMNDCLDWMTEVI